MIFYFSGTGNSYCVAKQVAESTNDRMVNVAEAWQNKQFSYAIAEGEKIGFIYPIHAWAPPTLMLRFIKKLQMTNTYDAYVYSLLTCGDDWEGSVERMKHTLEHIGLTLRGDFKLIMPDSCIINGDVDNPERAKRKLMAAPETLNRVINDIIAQKDTYRPVKYSFYKSHFIYSLFQIGKLFPWFKVNDDCVGCGMCAKACPMHMIEMKEKKNRIHKVPKWKRRGCVQCNACLNVCPKRAIDYFGAREKKVQYFNPEYRKEIAKRCQSKS